MNFIPQEDGDVLFSDKENIEEANDWGPSLVGYSIEKNNIRKLFSS